MIVAFAPGRVNLIGEHTDYTGGLVLPMALELGVTVRAELGGAAIELVSQGHESGRIDLPPPPLQDLNPTWARFVAAAAAEAGVDGGFRLSVTSDLPVGGTGLSSSSALTCATLLALGAEGSTVELAVRARRAEVAATGVEIGLMDQLASMGGLRDHALLIDCHDLALTPVALPPSVEVLVVHSGQERELADSAYQRRRQECEAIERVIGPLRSANVDRLTELADPVLRRRARHVVTENARVSSMIEALETDDPRAAGEILDEGHRSLAVDYEVSTPVVDAIVGDVRARPGVYGARLTGGGFGGSLVALCRPGTTVDVATWWTRARPGAGAHLVGA